MNRREALGFLGKVLVAISVSSGSLVVMDTLSRAYEKRNVLLQLLEDAAHPADDSLALTLAWVEQEYGLRIEFGERTGSVNFSETLSPEDKKLCAKLLLEELPKYPASFFRHNGIASLRFGKHMSTYVHRDGTLRPPTIQERIASLLGDKGRFERISIGGQVEGDGAAAIGLGDLPNRAEFVDALFFEKSVLHHEIYHLIDHRLLRGDGARDERWAALHDPLRTGDLAAEQVPYQGYGKYFLDTAPRTRHAGLIGAYGSADIREDRAMFAEVLMNTEMCAVLVGQIDRTASGPELQVLKSKWLFVMDDYERASGGVLNKEFWRTWVQQSGALYSRKPADVSWIT